MPFVIAGFFFLLMLLGIGSSVYFYRQYKISEEKLKNPGDAEKNEMKDMVGRVGKLMILPTEEPQMLTVGDVENLKKAQPFFQDAKNDDKVLLYPVARKAILYRPSENIIVNVAPLMNQEEATASGKAQTPQTQGVALKIALRNGSGFPGVTTRLEQELKTKMQNISITEKDNAKRMDYEKTVVIPLSQSLSSAVVQQLADMLSASVSALPIDEPKPASDLLIIAGKDRK